MSIRSHPTVSALVSVYIGTLASDFYAAYSSIVQSTVIPDQIVVVLDGSVSPELATYISELSHSEKIIAVYLDQNHGLGYALRVGLQHCVGDFIMRFDSDDINSPSRLEKQLIFLSLNPHIDILGSAVVEFVPSTCSNFISFRYKNVPLRNFSICKLMSFRNPLNHPTILFRRDCILSLSSYESVYYFEDYFLWLKARRKGFIFANLPIALVAMSRSSITERRSGLKYLKCELYFIRTAFLRRLISLRELFILSGRALFRIVPLPSSFLALLMPWRSKSYVIPKCHFHSVFK